MNKHKLLTCSVPMGSTYSTCNNEGSHTTSGLGDLPENCLAMILACLDPPDICNLARISRVFRQASSADSVWEVKLPEKYRFLAKKLMLYEGSFDCLARKDIYVGLCCPVRFSSGTKEVWMDKRCGGICMLVSWKGMKIVGINDRRYWTHIPTQQSRFHSIAYLQQIWWLQVEGDIEFKFPAGSYSLFFHIKLERPSNGRRCSSTTQQVRGWNVKPARFQFSVSNGQRVISESCLNEHGKWLNYHVGDFEVEDSYKVTKIKFSMTQIDCTHAKGGLALDCVFICSTRTQNMMATY